MSGATETKRFEHAFWSKAGLRERAQYLENNGAIYVIFGVGDGISNASSAFKYPIDLSNTNNKLTNDSMHAWLMSPLGIAIAVIETIFLMLFSILGNYFSPASDSVFKRFIAKGWPYIRDAVKAIKNAYKAVRSVLYIGIIFGASVLLLPTLLLPIGLTLGILSCANRAWNRTMGTARKNMQSANLYLNHWAGADPSVDRPEMKSRTTLLASDRFLKQLLLNSTISELQALKTDKEKENYLINNDLDPLDKLKLIQRQSGKTKRGAYLSAAYEGLTNGLYLYAGVYLLCVMLPPIALMVSIFSLFFVLSAVARSLYEEFDYQRGLELSAMHATYHLYRQAKEKILKDDPKYAEYAEKESTSEQAFKALKKATYGSAIGEGLRNGLALYSAITGLLFAVSLFTPIPLVVLILAIEIGFLTLCGFIGYMLWCTFDHTSHQTNQVPDAFEIGRSTASGIRNGQKVTNFTLNCLQEQGPDGHYRDSKPMFIVMIIISAIQSIVFGLKAFTKGFGRPPKDPENNAANKLHRTTSTLSPSASSDSIESPKHHPTGLFFEPSPPQEITEFLQNNVKNSSI